MFPVHGSSPYGRGKAVVESTLRDIAAVSSMRCVALRYFNPIGADPLLRSGMRGAVTSHVLDRLSEAYRTGEPFRIRGVDWPTRDGTAVRDYVHVWDLAQAHVAALQRFDAILPRPFDVLDLGSGHGTTVRELVAAFERVTGAPIAVRESTARPGDTVGCYSRSPKARTLLNWQPRHSIEDGIRHHLAWRERQRATTAA
jgi:UDP-glucose 4-epimerase